MPLARVHSTFPPLPALIYLNSAKLFRGIRSGQQAPTRECFRKSPFVRKYTATPSRSNRIARVFLLLLLFGKEIDNLLPVWRLGHALEKTKVALDILAPDEPIYLASKNPSLGSVEPPEKTV